MCRWLAIAAVLLVGGCTAVQPDDRFYSIGQTGLSGQRLMPHTTLVGYMALTNARGGALRRLVTGEPRLTPLVRQPVAVAADGDAVYILDQFSHAVYRFDWQIAAERHSRTEHLRSNHGGLTHPAVRHLFSLREIIEPTDLFVSSGGADIFVADGNGKKVVRYGPDGAVKRIYSHPQHLNRPVAVTVGRRGLRVIVADGLYDHLVVFNDEGEALYRMGGRGAAPGEFRNIRDMVQGPDRLLYVVDGIHRRVNVFGLDGQFLAAFGQGLFSDPGGIAVDEYGRVYVSDQFNHNILVFEDGRLVETVGASGGRPGHFQAPQGLAVGGARLYVADSQNGRIQVMRIVPSDMVIER